MKDVRLLASLSLVKPTARRCAWGDESRDVEGGGEQPKEIEFTSDARVSTSCSFEIKRRLNVARHINISIRALDIRVRDLFGLVNGRLAAFYSSNHVFLG